MGGASSEEGDVIREREHKQLEGRYGEEVPVGGGKLVAAEKVQDVGVDPVKEQKKKLWGGAIPLLNPHVG